MTIENWKVVIVLQYYWIDNWQRVSKNWNFKIFLTHQAPGRIGGHYFHTWYQSVCPTRKQKRATKFARLVWNFTSMIKDHLSWKNYLVLCGFQVNLFIRFSVWNLGSLHYDVISRPRTSEVAPPDHENVELVFHYGLICLIIRGDLVLE